MKSVDAIPPDPRQYVCAGCGSNEVQVEDWVRVNDGALIGDSGRDDYWCAECDENSNDGLVDICTATEYCSQNGHSFDETLPDRCRVCGCNSAFALDALQQLERNKVNDVLVSLVSLEAQARTVAVLAEDRGELGAPFYSDAMSLADALRGVLNGYDHLRTAERAR